MQTIFPDGMPQNLFSKQLFFSAAFADQIKNAGTERDEKQNHGRDKDNSKYKSPDQ